VENPVASSVGDFGNKLKADTGRDRPRDEGVGVFGLSGDDTNAPDDVGLGAGAEAVEDIVVLRSRSEVRCTINRGSSEPAIGVGGERGGTLIDRGRSR
jgi:hypothetical protein